MISLAVRRPVGVAMGCVAVIALGVAAFLRMPVKLFPEVEFPRLTIRAVWPGASPEVVEAFVTTRFEAAAQLVRGVRDVRSVSTEGQAEVTVEFSRDISMKFASLDLAERLGALQDALPPRVIPRVEPYVPPEFSQAMTFLEYALHGTFATQGLRELAEETLRPELLGVEGVAAVRLYGGEPREVRVVLDPWRMEALGLTVREVTEAILPVDVVRPAGSVRRRDVEWVVTVHAHVHSAADLAILTLTPDRAGSDRIVTLGDVATILETHAEPRYQHRIDGRPAVTIQIVRGLDTNALRVGDRVKAKVADLRSTFPPGLEMTLREDESAEIRRQLTDLRLRAATSALVVFLVLFVFLGSFRSAAVVFSTIAFSALLAVNLLFLAGWSLNLLTIAGLVMGFGLVVDNAIVVLENVYRRWRDGASPGEAAERGAREVALPVVASTFTTVTVFVPFLYLQGELRIYYLPFAYAVGLALLASLTVAFTLVPAIAARILPKGRRGSLNAAASPPVYIRLYRRLLTGSLRRPWVPVVVAILALMGSYHLFDQHVIRGPAWGSRGEESRIDILIGQPRGAELESTDMVARHFEAKLESVPHVEEFTTHVYPTAARIRVTFPDSLESTWAPIAIKEQMVAYSHLFGGTEVRVYGFGPSFYDAGGKPPSYALKILGYNYERVRDIAEALGARLRRVSRIRDVDTNASDYWYEREKATELVLALDRSRLAAHGASVREVLDQVEAAVQGQVAWSRVRLGGEEWNISVKLAGYERIDTQALENLLIPTPAGPVRLGAVAELDERELLSRIVRENQQYQRIVAYEFRGPQKMGDRVREAIVGATSLPPGYEIEKEWDGIWIEEGHQRQMFGVILLAVLLIYLVTAGLFESLRAPLVVLLTVPLALIGVFLIFFFSDAAFTRSGYLGVIMMAGIVVNNAILLVHHVNQLRRADGLTLEAAVLRGTLERVRPILMTTATTLLGILPVVLWSDAADTRIWNALGYALIGGLASSTVFVLTVTPAIYLWIERRAR